MYREQTHAYLFVDILEHSMQSIFEKKKCTRYIFSYCNYSHQINGDNSIYKDVNIKYYKSLHIKH